MSAHDRQGAEAGHTPVMLDRMLLALAPRDGATYVDGTFGAGGYSKAILEAAEATVYGIDRDPQAVSRAADLVRRYPGRLTVIAGRFGDMDRDLRARGVAAVDGIALDLGVSSMQLDQPERGFSFRFDAPLDMRMEGPSATSGQPSAADVVNDMAEEQLAEIIKHLGEERRARQVARAIAAARRQGRIESTGQLADIVRGAVGGGERAIDNATRTFQALRIHVNDELGELERGLGAAERLLAPGGRLVVVAFHSLEDRIVKSFLRQRSGAEGRATRHRPEAADTGPSPSFKLLFKRPCRPSRVECDANPRARSARLRAAERTAAPAWPTNGESRGWTA